MSWSGWSFPEASAERGRRRSVEVQTKVGNGYVKRKTHIHRNGKRIKWGEDKQSGLLAP